MIRADIEHTLRKSGWEEKGSFGCFYNSEFPNRTFYLEEYYVLFTRISYPRISYASLTPKLWTELTGLKFHPMEEK